MVFAPSFATARSGSVSPLKSPIPSDRGTSPTAKSVGAENVPPAPPSRIETVLACWFTIARSGSESPLNSPTATVWGKFPVAKLVGPLKLTACAAGAQTAMQASIPRSGASLPPRVGFRP